MWHLKNQINVTCQTSFFKNMREFENSMGVDSSCGYFDDYHYHYYYYSIYSIYKTKAFEDPKIFHISTIYIKKNLY